MAIGRTALLSSPSLFGSMLGVFSAPLGSESATVIESPSMIELVLVEGKEVVAGATTVVGKDVAAVAAVVAVAVAVVVAAVVVVAVAVVVIVVVVAAVVVAAGVVDSSLSVDLGAWLTQVDASVQVKPTLMELLGTCACAPTSRPNNSELRPATFGSCTLS
jgi:hypothetical protein